MKRLKTVIIVTCVAVLIWVFAEGESLRVESASGTVTIDPPPSMAARILDPEGFTGAVTFTLRGSTAGLDTVRDRLDQPLVLTTAAGLPTTAGDHVISLANALSEAAPFAEQGVVIQSVDPPALRVQLVSLEEVELPVVPQVEGAVEGAPTVEPDAITVRVPDTLVDALEDASAGAPIPAERLQNVEPGEPREFQNVRIELPPILRGHWAVRPQTTPAATVTLTLRDTTREAVIERVPVHVLLATSELGRWDITVEDPFIQNVTIRGPSDLVQRIAASMGPGPAPEDYITLVAVLPLGFEELEQGIEAKDVQFILQPAGGILEFEAPEPTVRLTVRKAPENAPPGAE